MLIALIAPGILLTRRILLACFLDEFQALISSKGLNHWTHLNFDDARASRLGASQEYCPCNVLRVEHPSLCDALFRPSPPQGKFRLDSTATNHTNFDAQRTHFFVH